MKKILFVIPDLGCGGAEKELVTLLSLLDPTKWQIDLFLFEDIGILREFIPDYVQVLPRDSLISIWNRPIHSSVISLLRVGKWGLAFKRILFGIEIRKAKSPMECSLLVCDYYRQILPRISERYDVAMGCMEGMSNYYVNEMTVADRKIASVHSDYEKMPHLSRELDALCFEKMDAVVTDSEGCREVIARTFPLLKEKFHAIEPFISPALIRDMALKQEDPFADGFNGVRILTLARLSHAKGIDIAVKACKILKDQGHPVRWYVLGDGEDRPSVTNLIASFSLQRDFILLGNRANPYPGMKTCDIYVQPSRWEGWGIAIEEAKILAKPVVLTRFRIAENRVEHMVTGMVVDMQETALAQGIAKLIDRPYLRAQFSQNIQSLKFGCDDELQKFNQLINGDI